MSKLFAIPIHRPVATSMFFLAISLLGLFSWFRIPIELIPALSGEQLFVQIYRPGSEPDVVEREILLPLESRIAELSDIDETWAEVNGSSATITIQFDPGSNVRVRELEISRIASDLNRDQPQGSFIEVSSNNSSLISRLVLQLQIVGGQDPNSLRDFADDQLQARFASVPGVSQALIQGAAPREVTVWIDPDKAAELGVRPEQVTQALVRSVQRLRYLGGVEESNRRMSVILDGRPGGVVSLGEIRIDPSLPVLLRHVAEIEEGSVKAESLFRINGQPALGLLLFQDEGANLVQLGRDLRDRIDELSEEYNPYGIDFVIGFDAAQTVDDQISHLKNLALSGFVIALLVLFLFLKEIRAVAVVAIAVPVSLLVGGALLFLGGWTLNIITLTGLAIGVGMLIDNSIVVYEAVQRCLEKGMSPQHAAIDGIQSTIRAILTASVTTAVVYLPVVFLVDDVMIRSILVLIAVAILLPLLASLLVAAGLVPLLAQKIAAPATIARLARTAKRREEYQGNVPVQRSRELFSGLLKIALRRPTPWLASVTLIIFLTLVIALPWVLVSTLSQEAAEASEVRLEVVMEGSGSLDSAGNLFERLEQAAMDIDGVERVSSSIEEESGTLTVTLVEKDERPDGINAGVVRRRILNTVNGLQGVEINTVSAGDNNPGGGGGGGGGLLGGGSSQIVLSGPDMTQLNYLAEDIQQRLDVIAYVEGTSISGRQGQEELQIKPILAAMDTFQLYPEEVLNTLNVFRREGTQMQVGFTLADGREIPMTIRQPEVTTTRASQLIEDLRIVTSEGALPLSEIVSVTNELPATTIIHHNGRRELAVNYQISDEAPKSGPSRQVLDEQIQQAARSAFFPAGYTVETAGSDDTSSLVNTLLLPILLLLYAVLAIAFESLTMPLLILLVVPLTILGATWALVIAGTGLDMMAGVGAVALLGLTVNPAIILVDRMQRRLHNSRCSGGTAAMGAVRERTRPVLMTSCTTIAGLWPLALVTGAENEIWPPFATIIIGGLTTSTLLTLLLIPVGFVFLSRLDKLCSKLGPWVLMGWAGATALVVVPLILTDQLTSFYWQFVCVAFVGSIFLWIAKKIFIDEAPVPLNTAGMSIETRYLSKIYGLPGPISKAWQSGVKYSQGLFSRSNRDMTERALTFFVLMLAASYLSINLNTMLWKLLFAYVGGALLSRGLIEVYRLSSSYRGITTTVGALAGAGPGSVNSSDTNTQEHQQKIESLILLVTPWLVFSSLFYYYNLLPWLDNQSMPLPPVALGLIGIITLLFQFGRITAQRISSGKIATVPRQGSLLHSRTAWRRFCVKFFSLGLDKEGFAALSNVSFKAEAGMIGILGPNGAGKTTLLRLLAGVFDSSKGTIHYAGVEKRNISATSLSEVIGYLPQEFGLPDHLTAQEYLRYYAILYRVGNQEERHQRVAQLLEEVGLEERKDEKIGAYSGGMRQRVAVARTLLRQPPVIIVDEPTVGLDPRERIRFRNLLSKLAKGRVVLFSTHVVEDVAVSCQRVLVFSKGEMVYDGNPADLTEVADGKVWEMRLLAGEDENFVDGAKVIDQIPEADGASLLRILSLTKPHPEAVAIDPIMEDGYLQLQKQGFEKGSAAGGDS